MVAPVEEWIETAHAAGVPVMVDASQSVSHLPIDVKKLGCDFLAFSSHKIFGPSGVGILYVASDRFEKLQLWNVGGGMVNYHGEDRFEVREAPFRYEAGTPNIEGAIGLGAAHRVRARGRAGEDCRPFARARRSSSSRGWRAARARKVLGAHVPPERRIALCTLSVPVPSMTQANIARLLADSHAIWCRAGFTARTSSTTACSSTARCAPRAHLFNDADRHRAAARLRDLV